MDVGLFDFALPDERIALRPAEPRETARLLRVPPSGAFEDAKIGDLPDVLRDGDVLVVNDTRVIAGALAGVRERALENAGDTGAGPANRDGNRGTPPAATIRVSANLFERRASDTWRLLLRPAKKVRVGDTLRFVAPGEARDATGENNAPLALSGEVVAHLGDGRVDVRFAEEGEALDAALTTVGHMPLPPYIARRRAQDDADRADYQTMFAAASGAVAAPTAGLHFTPKLMARLNTRGITRETVTLHVGGGTFLPVKADDTRDHVMHGERGIIDAATADRLAAARADGRRIVAIGTTSLRLLEAAASAHPQGTITAFDGETDIFITPGYAFRAVDALLTNFHLPRSTLFMLVSAFSGLARMQEAYAHAISAEYRFYSYGDACLLERGQVSA
ncbi:MAG: tRNA preQ1(34) S-adenosylmethionine ribosyltransferase-isomerase QueA [Pseudomonadota bacterium]